MKTKPNKTAKEFDKMALDPIRCYNWNEIWNWHISQLKKLEKEIKGTKKSLGIHWFYNDEIGMTGEEIGGYNRALSDILDLISDPDGYVFFVLVQKTG